MIYSKFSLTGGIPFFRRGEFLCQILHSKNFVHGKHLIPLDCFDVLIGEPLFERLPYKRRQWLIGDDSHDSHNSDDADNDHGKSSSLCSLIFLGLETPQKSTCSGLS